MEYGINELSQKNKIIYNKVKENTNDGIYDYIQISEIPNQGRIVKATKCIKKQTLILRIYRRRIYLQKFYSARC